MSRDQRGSRFGGSRETHDPARYVFHYSRDERLQGREEREPAKGIFKRNRSLLIILLDVLLVLLMFILYLLFFRSDAGTVRFDGYRAEGSAFVFDEQVFVTVTVIRTEEGTVIAGDETLLRIRFPDDSAVSDVLPADPQFATVVRHVMTGPVVDSLLSEDAVEVTLEVAGAEHELLIPLESD